MTEKLDVGRIIEGVFEIYREHAAVLLPAAAAVFLIEAILSAILVAISPVLVLVAIVVQVAISTLYQGMVVTLVSDVQDGRRDASVEQLFKSVTPVLLPLIGAGILAGLGIGLGFVFLIVPGLILLTIWAVIAPAIVVERQGVLSAFGRSLELVRGNAWQVFGVIVIFFLILLVVGFVFGVIGAVAGTVGRLILEFIGSVLTAPLVALAAAVLYFNLRAAKGETAPPGGQLDATGAAAGGVGAGAPGQPTQQPAERPADQPTQQPTQPPAQGLTQPETQEQPAPPPSGQDPPRQPGQS